MEADRPPDLRQRAREIFLEALDYPEASAREAFLATACGSDPLLRRRLESMLSEHFVEDDFMATSASGDAVNSEPAGAVGTTIGRYKQLQEIGEGGMGVVYLAEQQKPVRRKVALKIIKLGMDTRQVVAPFEAERQALAPMDHPNIAKVLDAGVTGQRSEIRDQQAERLIL